MSHCWTSTFDDHFNRGFFLLKDVQHIIGLRKFRICRHNVNVKQNRTVVRGWSFGLIFGVCSTWSDATSLPVPMNPWFSLIGLEKSEILQSLNPKDQELGYRPCVNLHRLKLSQLRLNYVKLRFVSCTSNPLARTCDFRICTTISLDLVSSKSPAKSES